MERFADIKLISQEYTKDSIGQLVPVKTEHLVMASVRSVSAAEFFRGGAEGLKPDLVFLVWEVDYSDETVVEYDEKEYSVYRKYMNDDGKVELYTERKVGNG